MTPNEAKRILAYIQLPALEQLRAEGCLRTLTTRGVKGNQYVAACQELNRLLDKPELPERPEYRPGVSASFEEALGLKYVVRLENRDGQSYVAAALGATDAEKARNAQLIAFAMSRAGLLPALHEDVETDLFARRDYEKE